MVLVPTSSISGYDRFIRCLKSTSLNFVANPIAAFAEKYCAVIATAHPTIASINRTTIIRKIYGMSPSPIPLSIRLAMTIGTMSSKHASSILKPGARIHSLTYSFRYGNSFLNSHSSYSLQPINSSIIAFRAQASAGKTALKNTPQSLRGV